MLNRLKMQVFLDVCQTLNFSKTAERLYISQQSVSKHIADLEREMGTVLINRVPHHVNLTRAGLKVQELFMEFNDRYNSLIADISKNAPAGMPTTLKVGYQDHIRFGDALRSAIRSLRSDYPNISIAGQRLDPAALLKLLSTDRLDAIVILKRFLHHTSRFNVRELLAAPLVLYVDDSNPLICTPGGYLKFAHAPLLINGLEGETPEQTVARERKIAEQRGFVPSQIIVLPNRESIYTEAGMGRGVFFGSLLADIPMNISFARYDTKFDDAVCFVTLKSTRNKCIDEFAENLKRDLVSQLKFPAICSA
jgi:DNA-binding transcriptional LysR family regulator